MNLHQPDLTKHFPAFAHEAGGERAGMATPDEAHPPALARICGTRAREGFRYDGGAGRSVQKKTNF